MYFKNTPAALLARTLGSHLLYNVAAAAYFARRRMLTTFVSAKVAAVAGMGRILRQRAAVQRSRVVNSRAIEAQLERRWLSAKMREKAFDVSIVEQAR